MPNVPVETVRDLLTRLFISQSLFRFDAETVATRLIEADLRGQHRYGAALAPQLVDDIKAGHIDPRGRVLTVHETPAIAVLDGSRAVGAVAATKGMQAAVAKAREVGVGTAVVANSQSFGAASIYALLAAKEGMIGFVTSNSGPASVAAFGGFEPAVGNHPVAWAVPLPNRSPFVIDFSCGSTSWSDVHAAGDAGRPLEEGLALDEAGEPTTHPRKATTLLPMFGARGFGMSFACSVLTAGLGGGKMPVRQRKTGPSEDAQHFFQAFDPAAFADPQKFARELTSAMDQIRGLKPAPGFDRIRFAGDEDDIRAARIQAEGIPLDEWSHNELGLRTPGGWK